ncbi:uncharacterized protein C12orf76 homolog [Pantherophis guttatus]|uniref:Uncharacterized protein C12orf76 homolog n=1 Tax=Pantherophis guttatus TaxID=94885 RepID=A0ABM3YNQ5_PANGU|nr:uncharacterized protein C12orf76 homolog [Pantherophis guttatus]
MHHAKDSRSPSPPKAAATRLGCTASAGGLWGEGDLVAAPPIPCGGGRSAHVQRPLDRDCERLSWPCAVARMPRSRRGSALLALLLLLLLPLAVALGEAGEAAASGQQRPFAVLRRQNLALLGSVFGLLVLAAVLLAVCVYRPLRRR